LLVALVAVGLFIVSRGGRQRPSGTEHPAVGEIPAHWKLAPLTGEGRAIDLAALRGKVTLVNFWGTWCPPCREEFPHMVEISEAFARDADFQFASVSCDPGPEKDIDELRLRTAEYLSAAGAKFPAYYDPQGVSRIAAMDLNAGNFGFPTTILFDRAGKIRGYWTGYFPGVESDIRQATKSVLAAKE
jgi:thiol-disulfide isomerase/thioredoxin